MRSASPQDVILIHRKFDKEIGAQAKLSEHVESTLLHWHDFFEIEIIVNGCGSIGVNGNEINAVPGLICCFSPNDLHVINSESESGFTLYNVAFDESIVDSGLMQKLLCLSRFGVVDPDSTMGKHIISTVDMLSYECNSDGEYRTEGMRFLLSYLIILLTRSLDRADAEPSELNACPDLIRSVIAYINRNYCSELKLRDIAEMFYVNEHYISSLFYKKVGKKFCNYLAELRVNHASNLLRTTSLPVADISAMCGFGSYSNFTRTFKRWYGISPTQLRNSDEKPE